MTYPTVTCPKCGLKHNMNHIHDLCEEHVIELIWGAE